MELPNDLKDYKAPLGAFQIIEEGSAMLAFFIFLLVCVILAPYIR